MSKVSCTIVPIPRWNIFLYVRLTSSCFSSPLSHSITNYNTPLIDDLNHEEEFDPSVVVNHYCQCWKKFIRRGEVYVFFSAGGGELREWMVAIVLFVYRKTYSKLLCIFFFFFHSYLCRLMRLHS